MSATTRHDNDSARNSVAVPSTPPEAHQRAAGEATTAVRFNKHHVANGEYKARAFYSVDNRADGRKCVTVYAKDFGGVLGKILKDAYRNDSDHQTDYFDEGRAVLFEGHPLYVHARERAESNAREDADRAAAKAGARRGRS